MFYHILEKRLSSKTSFFQSSPFRPQWPPRLPNGTILDPKKGLFLALFWALLNTDRCQNTPQNRAQNRAKNGPFSGSPGGGIFPGPAGGEKMSHFVGYLITLPVGTKSAPHFSRFLAIFGPPGRSRDPPGDPQNGVLQRVPPRTPRMGSPGTPMVGGCPGSYYRMVIGEQALAKGSVALARYP